MSVSSITPATGVVVILPATIVALGWGAPLALLAAGVMCLPIAYCYATLGREFPSAGVEFAFAARFLGPGSARATWLTTVAGVTLALAAIIQGATGLLGGLIDAVPPWWLLPLIAIIPMVLAPLRILRVARITSAILWTEIAALVAVTAFGVWLFLQGGTSLATCASVAAGSVSSLDTSTVLAHTAIAYFALAGFGTAVVLSEEDQDGGRSAARAVRWSLLVALGLELVALSAILLALGCGPGGSQIGTGTVLSDFAALNGSTVMRAIVLGGAFVAALNAAIVITMQIGRVVYSAAREGFIPGGGSTRLRRVSPATNTPIAATLVVISAATVVGVFVSPGTLILGASATLMVPPTVVAVSHIAWQHRGPDRPDTTVLQRLIPVAALAGLLVVAVFALGSAPAAFTVAAAAWVIGLVLARVWPAPSGRQPLPPDVLERVRSRGAS